jgi:predicted transposase YdaD
MKHAIEIMLEERDKDIAEQSKLEEKERIARVMLACGEDADKVAKVTGLTIDDVLRLQSE